MRFREVFRFELRYQLSQISTWLIFAVLTGLSFLITRDGSLSEALHDDFFLNSPFSIAKTTVAGSLIWLLMAAGITGEAGARDVSTGMHQLTFTSGISKASYLGGKYMAAFFLNACLLLAVPAGILVAVYSPGVDEALIGPFRPAAYLTAYAFIALPNALTATALQFGIAVQSGRPMASYLGSVLLFFMSYIVGLFLLFQGRQQLANYLDPIGVHFILSELSHLWTPFEKSHRLITLEGTVGTNRLVWVGVALLALTVCYMRFHFSYRTSRVPLSRLPSWFLGRVKQSIAGPGRSETQYTGNYNAGAGATSRITTLPAGFRSFGLGFQLRQTLAIAWDAFLSMAKSWAGLFMVVVIPLLSVLVVMDQMDMNGVPLIPKTGRVLSELTAPLVADMSRWVIVPVLIIFFAGGLVWRERDAGLGEITDALPGSEWPPFAGKFLALTLLLALFMFCLMAAGIIAQFMMNYQNFELSLYLRVLFGLQLPEYLLFALLALVIHSIVHQKYIGHLAALIAWVMIALAPMFGIEHDLLIFGAGPRWSYTEMSGFGNTIVPWLWFKIYWAAWSLMLAVCARIFWVRGREKSLSARLALARQRLNGTTARFALLALMLLLICGGYIFHNTNVLNEYLTRSQIADRHASYEKQYGRYSASAQPTLASTSLQIDLYPDQNMADIGGEYALINLTNLAIDTIHLATVSSVKTGAVVFDRNAKLLLDDEVLGHRIYRLSKPLNPGDSIKLKFRVHIQAKGFKASGLARLIVSNGTYFTNHDYLPVVGYQRSRELTSAVDRRERGLPPRPLIASLYDTTATRDRGLPVHFEAIIGTSADQVAIAPGVLQRRWTKNGRNYFHYKSDKPLGTENHFFSANYKVHEAMWTDTIGGGREVAIKIYHDPAHTSHIARTISSIKASLDYYTKQFGPYRYNQVVFAEQPGDGDGAGIHAVAGMLIYEEGFCLWNPGDSPGELDHPYAVVAHEMAHQWTVPYANVEGAPVVSESLAWYYAMKAVQHSRGQQQLDGLLHFMHQPHPHPPIRRGEPLLRGLDPYLSYRKGPFALYALSEYMGEERVHAALRRFVDKHSPPGAPLATTLDLYEQLKSSTPDSLLYLLYDLFEANTFWELKTKQASAKKIGTNMYEVKLDLQSRKLVVDTAGFEKELPMDEWIEIGIYAEGQEDDRRSAPRWLQKCRVHKGEQSLILVVPFNPIAAGIDPRKLLPDMDTGDNTKRIKI